MPRLPIQATSALEAEVRALKNELFVTRYAMIGLMRPELEDRLHGFLGCNSFKDFYEWKARASDGVIDYAAREDEKVVRLAWVEHRVVCPLCSRGPDSHYHDGFLLPEGLRRHLLGTHSAQQCPVFRAAEQIALDGARDAEGR